MLRPSLAVRCPAERTKLRDKLANIFGLVPSSVKLVYQAAQGEWREVGTIDKLVRALDAQPDLQALPVHVRGEEMLHLPLLQMELGQLAHIPTLRSPVGRTRHT